jgi:hypothetical protein
MLRLRGLSFKSRNLQYLRDSLRDRVFRVVESGRSMLNRDRDIVNISSTQDD